jgi:hypothetical protein
MKALHINEIRTAVNTARSGAGLGGYPWTDNPVVTGSTLIKAVHFVELRAAIQDLWLSKRLGLVPLWSAIAPPAARTNILASDINDLRAWVNTYENAAALPADPQGVVSFSYQPAVLNADSNIDGPYIVTNAWCEDAYALKTGGQVPLRLRTLIQSRHTSNSDNTLDQTQKSLYEDAFLGWKSTWASHGREMDVGISWRPSSIEPRPSGHSQCGARIANWRHRGTAAFPPIHIS